MTQTPAPAPVAPKDRITAIDTLRGFALLGILIMNIQGFAMIEAAYANPTLHMDLTGINWLVWVFGHVFADMKFMAIFSMLFGAGIIILTAPREARGEPTLGLHYKRNFWLLVFGLTHAYLIWPGDILVTYALCGFVVYWMRNFAPTAQVIIALLLLSIAPALSFSAPPEVQAELVASAAPGPEWIAGEIAAMRGSWADGLQVRILSALGFHLEAIPFFLFWRASGLMMLGMALFKWGVLSAERTPQFYNRMLAIGLAAGLPLMILSVTQNAAVNWHPLYAQFGVGALFNYIGSLPMALAYIALIMRLSQIGTFAALQTRLSAVGRMAFTNYIMQSILCTFVFYGFGLGLFGYVERWGQILIVLAVWLLQLILSPWWLARYRFGPLEWAWRSLTYMRLQKMRK